MKKLTILSLSCILIVFACTKKAVPVISARTEFPEPPKTAKTPAGEITVEMIAAGKKVYDGKCSRCHDLKDPKAFDAGRWGSILKTMIPRARLNDKQAAEVRAYVMANAKK